MKSAATKSLPLLGKLFHPLSEGFISVWLLLIAQGVPSEANEATGTSLAQPKAAYYINSCFSSCLGL
jgi:hypothetical protein